ncbi:MAG: transposase [Planctomycetes bacterium]|nr:transposase [Planctomycetota bacterium]
MDAREQRGLVIAALCKIDRKGGIFLVPSQSGKGRYTVCPDPASPHCSCPDHEATGQRCKHIFAVEFSMKREQNNDGTVTVTEQVTITKRQTYPQQWEAYNAAQTHEKEKFLDLLRGLCDGVSAPRTGPKGGHPRLPLGDAVFAACYKVYSTVSGRRFMSDLRAAQAAGYLMRLPHFNSIFKALENPALTPVLRAMIAESSLPLKTVERDFACDSSGFTTSRFIRWYDHKYGQVRQQHEWVKVHLMCGVKTNIVTAVEIRDKQAQDAPLMPALVDATARHFTLREVTGDKAYASYKNYDAIEAHGATPFIPFKETIHTGKRGGLWTKMYHYFQYRREEFLEHYHKRSNAESTFSMIKAKFRDHVRSKTDTAMVNEVLCKILCHNICCLIQESHELGISPVFWDTPAPACC